MRKKAISKKVLSFSGEASVIADKSISHRALIIASQAIGITTITNIADCTDVRATIKALKSLGVKIIENENHVMVHGVGVGGLSTPDDVLNFGNSGTASRLIMGLVTPYSFFSILTGDESLRSRPMDRVIAPLSLMGASFLCNKNKLLPIVLRGASKNWPISYTMPVPSAQVKSAILLAALNIKGITQVIENLKTRNHTEIMLKLFGAQIKTVSDERNYNIIELEGEGELYARDIIIPGDPSAASFLIAAALIIPQAKICIKNVLVNPFRIGFFETLLEMGANIQFINRKNIDGEDIADVYASSSVLNSVNIPASRAVKMIDEYPIMAVVAAYAKGISRFNELSELKIKESDRLTAILVGLSLCGVKIYRDSDNLIIEGGEQICGGVEVQSYGDHRIAMSFLILGTVAQKPITVEDINCIDTSFPDFIKTINYLGGAIETVSSILST